MASKAVHPVIEAIQRRIQSGSTPGDRDDHFLIGLAIEGGAMRGVVTNGMVVGLERLGALPAFDRVYGTSAGAISGAFFVAGQADRGLRNYYEKLNNRSFIDPRRLLVSKRPMVDMDFLFDQVIDGPDPLHSERVTTSGITLRPIATSVDRMRSVALPTGESERQLLDAIRASATMPVLAGRPVVIEGERYLDGGLLQPIPVPAAKEDGCTHILVLRSKPTGPTPHPSWLGRTIARLLMNRIRPGFGAVYLQGAANNERTVAEIDDATAHPTNQPFVFGITPDRRAPQIGRFEKNAESLQRAGAEAIGSVITAFSSAEPMVG